MIYNWFKIFNLTEFAALSLPSREYKYLLGDYGLKTILVTKGNYTSILIDGVLLSLNMNDKNPFEFEDHAIYLDENNDVHIGFKIDQD